MNARPNLHNFNTPALQRSLVDVVAEYDLKLAGIAEAEKAFARAGTELKMACTVGGTFGDVTIDTGSTYTSSLQLCLLRSAWKHVYEGLQLDRIASSRYGEPWSDLPVGSFSASGTNINTTVLTLHKPK